VFSAGPTVPVAKSNLVAWWLMDGNPNDLTAGDSSFGDTTDYSGTQNGGSFTNTSIKNPQTGNSIQAYDFGNGSRVEYPFTDPPAVDTITCWVSIDEDSNFGFFSNFNKTGNDFRGEYFPGSDELGVFVDSGGVDNRFPNATQNTFLHIAMTFGSTSAIYLNGNTTPEATSGAITGSIDSGANYATGQRIGPSQPGEGRVADLRLYNTELTPSQINQIYQNTEP